MVKVMFRDRKDAGQILGHALPAYAGTKDAIVLGLPRGGVVVAAEVARMLNLPLDIIVPRKIGAEGNPEYAIGAITENGEMVRDETKLSATHPEYIQRVVRQEQAEARRRLALYRGSRAPRNIKGKIAILVDDGVATGYTMLAAIQTARAEGVKKVIVAVPHGAASSVGILKEKADEVIVLSEPEPYFAVGRWYESFPQTSDEEVIDLLRVCRGSELN